MPVRHHIRRYEYVGDVAETSAYMSIVLCGCGILLHTVEHTSLYGVESTVVASWKLDVGLQSAVPLPAIKKFGTV